MGGTVTTGHQEKTGIPLNPRQSSSTIHPMASPGTLPAKDRVSCAPTLFGSLLSFLAAAGAAAQATPEHALPAALAAFAPGVAAILINETHQRMRERDAQQKARRNHLIRRGMALALRHALLELQHDCEEVPAGLQADLFTHWPSLLEEAETGDDLIDRLFPLSSSEDQWHLLNRYYDDLQQAEQAQLPSEKLSLLREREAEDQHALVSLLCDFDLQPADDRILDLRTLADRWPPDQALAFATRLLPRYRIAFAMVVSEDGPIQEAIAFKAAKFTRAQLEDIQREMTLYYVRLSAQLAGVSTQVAVVDDKVDGVSTQIAELRAILERAIAAGQIPAGAITPENKEARVAETARELPGVVEQIRESASPVATATVEQLLAAGKLEEAAIMAQTRFDSARKGFNETRLTLAQAAYDLGSIHEISFRWTDALENFRQAWDLSDHRNTRFGFKLARFAASLNLHSQAIAAYEAVLPLYTEPAAHASTFNNLGNLYQKTQRHAEAEESYREALALYRKLAAANPAAYEPDLAATLNNLGILYRNTQRHAEAEEAYREALALYRKLAAANPAAYEPDVAMTLNNLGILYRNTQRHAEAEESYREALALYRKLAAANPAAYEPDLAATLNNLGILYRNTQRHAEAEEAYREALALYRKLADANPAAYEPDLAMTLNNLGNLYANTQRHAEAEESYRKALALRRKLAAANPAAYEPNLASTLNNLGILYAHTQRHAEAEESFREALALYRKLAAANPAAYEPDVAMTLNNLGILYANTQRHAEAEEAFAEANAIARITKPGA